jgi:hypothetical protein
MPPYDPELLEPSILSVADAVAVAPIRDSTYERLVDRRQAERHRLKKPQVAVSTLLYASLAILYEATHFIFIL